MDLILRFGDEGAAEHRLVGGKGANLGRMAQAGFDVPTGFTVSTEAYEQFLHSTGLAEKISVELAGADRADSGAVDACCATAQEMVRSAAMPADIAGRIESAYREMGDVYVAVRSSGTAEDLAGASFAGLHDTYLDVRGAEAVIRAVQDCWASLWTPRAVVYREGKGFDHAGIGMAVVVQTMASAEVSGVMFTGNPLTTATDEAVINASWGLGEAVVQGIVSPDLYTVKLADLRVKEKVIGHKTVQVVRNPDTGVGTVECEVEGARRDAVCLTDAQIAELAELGRRIMEHYEGIPQDVEWALTGSGDDTRFHVLQSRPITGVPFSWDIDVDNSCSWQKVEEDDDTIWTRGPSDDVWTGAKTPLFYSLRGESWEQDLRKSGAKVMGKPHIDGFRFMKYWKGEAYCNVEFDRTNITLAPPAARPGMARYLPPDMQDDAINAPFSYLDYLKMLARGRAENPRAGFPYGWINAVEKHYMTPAIEAQHDGLPDEALPSLSDTALRRYAQQQLDLEHEYNLTVIWPGMWIYIRDIMTALYLIVDRWYDGDNEHAYTDLIAGTPKVSVTLREHNDLHAMASLIRTSPELTAALERGEDGGFFDTLADSLSDSSDGRALQELIDAFMVASGHRGHSDRDVIFERYADKPAVLFRALQAHVKSDEDPMTLFHANNTRRAEAKADVEANIRRKPLGGLKVEAFKWCLEYVLNFQISRDNERHFVDRSTYSLKKAFNEVGRRLRERGQLVGDRDHYFLTQYELFDLLAGAPATALTRAKIEARMRDFDAYDAKDYLPPKFLRHNRALYTAPAAGTEKGVLRGLPTSRGTVTGTARVVKKLSEIGRVNKGEILVANSTDPGWTPVFAVISGVVVETGGLMSHSSCLAREYGFPAALIEGAVRSIPDGAMITLNGDTGEVRIEQEPLHVEAAEAELAVVS